MCNSESFWKRGFACFGNGKVDKESHCSRDVAVNSRKRSREDEDDGNDQAHKKPRYSPEYGSFSESSGVESLADKSPGLSSEHIKIVVGQSCTMFTVPMKQLYSSSEYFKRIFNSDWWKEKRKRTFPLVGCHPKAFNFYAKWLDTCKVDLHEEGTVEGTEAYLDEESHNICRCYKLAGLLEDDDFKDAMIDAMINNLAAEDIVMQDLPYVIYPSSATKSPHRQLVVDCVINTWTQDCFDEMSQEKFPHEFLLDLAMAMGSQIRTGVPLARSDEFFKDIDTCKYHEHTKKNAPCYKDKHNISSEMDEMSCE